MSSPIALDPQADVVTLTARLVDVPSVSGDEQVLADASEAWFRALPHLDVSRMGNVIVARTNLGRPSRVVIAGHLDTVPANNNLPHRIVGDELWGLGACDMKSGDAVLMCLARDVMSPRVDVTYVLYDCEEVEAQRNGLVALVATHPDWLHSDFAILMEPTDGAVEAGCQGTLRAEIRVTGERAHSARSWKGVNAIHGAQEILQRLSAYVPRSPWVEGVQYREGLNAVGITGGVAGNVIPDECVVTVNYRFAPDRTVDEAIAHVTEVFAGFDVRIVDHAPAARPGLDSAAVEDFVGRVDVPVRAKYGWTDVARFTALGIPAVNFGPGDPSLAHHADERVSTSQIVDVYHRLATWLVE